MQLIKKLFGKAQANAVGPESVQFHESDSGFGPESRNAPRRELVQVVPVSYTHLTLPTKRIV